MFLVVIICQTCNCDFLCVENIWYILYIFCIFCKIEKVLKNELSYKNNLLSFICTCMQEMKNHLVKIYKCMSDLKFVC